MGIYLSLIHIYAAKLGAELFVLDDGWFGARDNDAKGLGDYIVNRKKLPGGLAGLAEKVHALGLLFGLWFEPEKMCIRDRRVQVLYDPARPGEYALDGDAAPMHAVRADFIWAVVLTAAGAALLRCV